MLVLGQNHQLGLKTACTWLPPSITAIGAFDQYISAMPDPRIEYLSGVSLQSLSLALVQYLVLHRRHMHVLSFAHRVCMPDLLINTLSCAKSSNWLNHAPM